MNKTTNTKVGQMNNSLKLKVRRLKRRVISRFQLLIIYMHKIIMNNKNNKGRVGNGLVVGVVLAKVANLIGMPC